MGSVLGAAVGRAVETSLAQTRVLIGAGPAAGFAAAYYTPFAASLFVLETIAGVAAPELLLPVMAATVGAAGIMRATVGPGPIYGQRAFGVESYAEFLAFASLGIGAALVALAFKTVLAVLERWFDTHPVPQPFQATLGGLPVGAIAMWLPTVVGNGYEPLNRILDSGIAVSGVIVLIIAKMIATGGSVASEIPGGFFTPMVLVAAALGAGWSTIASFGRVRRGQPRTRRDGSNRSEYSRAADGVGYGV